MSEQIDDLATKKSRRALLAAAVGGAAAVAASAALPVAVSADDPNDVVKETVNTTTDTTTIDSSATADVDTFAAIAGGTGDAIVATAEDGSALSAANSNVVQAAAYITSGDPASAVGDTSVTGLYAFTPESGDPGLIATAVWGDSPDAGVYGTGSWGVIGYGGIGVEGIAFGAGGWGVRAVATSTNQVALKVEGKVQFSSAGRSTISAGHSSITITRTGVTSSSRIFAVLASNRSGRYVRAVVPTTGKFTIYLNTTVTSSTYVTWWIIN